MEAPISLPASMAVKLQAPPLVLEEPPGARPKSQVVGGAVDLVEGLPIAKKQRHVGFEEDHACRQHPVDNDRVRLCDIVL